MIPNSASFSEVSLGVSSYTDRYVRMARIDVDVGALWVLGPACLRRPRRRVRTRPGKSRHRSGRRRRRGGGQGMRRRRCEIRRVLEKEREKGAMDWSTAFFFFDTSEDWNRFRRPHVHIGHTRRGIDVDVGIGVCLSLRVSRADSRSTLSSSSFSVQDSSWL